MKMLCLWVKNECGLPSDLLCWRQCQNFSSAESMSWLIQSASVCAGELCSGVLLPAAEGAVRRRADQACHPPPLLQQRHQWDRIRPSAHLRFGGVQQTAGRQKHQPAPVHLPSPKIKEWGKKRSRRRKKKKKKKKKKMKKKKRRRRKMERMRKKDGDVGGGAERKDVMKIKERHHWTTDTS